MKYTINSIDPVSGYIDITFIADDGISSQMVLASQLNGQPFTLSDTKQVNLQLLTLRDNWIAQNPVKVMKTIDPALQQYVLSAAVEVV